MATTVSGGTDWCVRTPRALCEKATTEQRKRDAAAPNLGGQQRLDVGLIGRETLLRRSERFLDPLDGAGALTPASRHTGNVSCKCTLTVLYSCVFLFTAGSRRSDIVYNDTRGCMTARGFDHRVRCSCCSMMESEQPQ